MDSDRSKGPWDEWHTWFSTCRLELELPPARNATSTLLSSYSSSIECELEAGIRAGVCQWRVESTVMSGPQVETAARSVFARRQTPLKTLTHDLLLYDTFTDLLHSRRTLATRARHSSFNGRLAQEKRRMVGTRQRGRQTEQSPDLNYVPFVPPFPALLLPSNPPCHLHSLHRTRGLIRSTCVVARLSDTQDRLLLPPNASSCSPRKRPREARRRP